MSWARPGSIIGLFAGLAGSLAVALAYGAGVPLKDGRTLEGEIQTVRALAENPLKANANQSEVRLIMLVDDNLRRVFVPKSQWTGQTIQVNGSLEQKIQVRQRVAFSKSVIAKVGPFVKITPWDAHGRRTLTMQTDRGPVDVIQGITEITPVWTRVQALASAKQSFQWDMRIATSSIPRDTLREILVNREGFDPKKIDDRLPIVRLMLQSQRYLDAEEELKSVIKDFPDEQRLAGEVQALRQLAAKQIIEQIQLLRQSGQHQQAYLLLSNFPKENISGETLVQVKQLLDEYGEIKDRGAKILEHLKADVEAIKDSHKREQCLAMQKEIATELNINTLNRMADYFRLMNDPQLSAEERAALAISGWVLGSNAGEKNLFVSLSLVDVRNHVRDYLREPAKGKRGEILRQLKGLEGVSPKTVAQVLDLLNPPVVTAPQNDIPGQYELHIPGFDKEPDVTYLVQLPPEYDPTRRYPAIVTLNGGGSTPAQQISWWAGDPHPKTRQRQGQATRNGYIVIAVDWAKTGQTEYEYSAREHMAVLGSLRAACQRFSIDTDRVFLSGHSMGADAVWDIGLSHPDLWAGLIPIVGLANRYCAHYRDNCKLLPCYVVSGELDGDRTVKNAENLLNHALTKGYDVTVVEYQGRGHEDFHDEIHRIFDWTSRRQRNFFPKDFQATTMRSLDSFFWWLEVRDLPSETIVESVDWPPGRGFRPSRLSAKITVGKDNNNYVSVLTGAKEVTIWLSPELIDFNLRTKITVKGKPKNQPIEPDLAVLLDDALTRGDRRHPFWVKIEQ